MRRTAGGEVDSSVVCRLGFLRGKALAVGVDLAADKDVDVACRERRPVRLRAKRIRGGCGRMRNHSARMDDKPVRHEVLELVRDDDENPAQLTAAGADMQLLHVYRGRNHDRVRDVGGGRRRNVHHGIVRRSRGNRAPRGVNPVLRRAETVAGAADPDVSRLYRIEVQGHRCARNRHRAARDRRSIGSAEPDAGWIVCRDRDGGARVYPRARRPRLLAAGERRRNPGLARKRRLDLHRVVDGAEAESREPRVVLPAEIAVVVDKGVEHPLGEAKFARI